MYWETVKRRQLLFLGYLFIHEQGKKILIVSLVMQARTDVEKKESKNTFLCFYLITPLILKAFVQIRNCAFYGVFQITTLQNQRLPYPKSLLPRSWESELTVCSAT